MLVLLGYWAWKQTNEIISMNLEELKYVRKPIIQISSDNKTGMPQKDAFWWKRFYVSNVGNDTAFNFFLRSQLFLVTDSEILSWGQYDPGKAYFTDTDRTAREMIWPKAQLAPDEIIDIERYGDFYLVSAFNMKLDKGANPFRRDLHNLALLLGGRYVLVIMCSYRRSVDFASTVDTFCLDFNSTTGVERDLTEEVGGASLCERVKSHMYGGKEISIHILPDHYELYYAGCAQFRFGKMQVLKRDTTFLMTTLPSITRR